jgi:hypothetical protein
VNVTRLRGSLAFLLCLVLTGGLFGAASAQDATPEPELTIYGPDEMVGNASLGEWVVRSWQWTLSLPEEIYPGFTPDGTGCGYGQSGPVFFLPSSFVPDPTIRFECTVPAGTAILMPVGGIECSTVEPTPFFGRDEAELRSCAEGHFAAIVAVEASINGEPVPNLDQYKVASPAFSVTFPEGNFYGVEPGVAMMAAVDYAFIFAAPPGEYEIVASMTVDGISDPFMATITVIVEAPQIIEPEASPAASPVT